MRIAIEHFKLIFFAFNIIWINLECRDSGEDSGEVPSIQGWDVIAQSPPETDRAAAIGNKVAIIYL